jgi:hypothetical protein
MSSSARVTAVVAVLLSLAACGSGSAIQPPTATQPARTGVAGTGPPAAITPAAATAEAGPTVAAATSAGVDTPGSVGWRFVHLYARPDGTTPTLEVFARSDGFVNAYPVRSGVTLGSVLDYIHPPAGGGVVAMETGDTGQATCITNCTHFVVDVAAAGGEGDRRTVVVYPENPSFIASQNPSEFAGTIEFWEDPKPASIGQFGNALMPADPARGLLFVVGAGVPEARFGLRLAFAGKAGCQASLNQPGGMIGGNQVPAYAIAGDVMANLHGGSDADCSKPPVGGPFPVTGAPGSRGYLFLYGTFAALQAVDVPID